MKIIRLKLLYEEMQTLEKGGEIDLFLDEDLGISIKLRNWNYK